jgi:quinoprotein glucose dehydrogenase
MPRASRRTISALAIVVLAVSMASSRASGQKAASALPSTANGEWPHYAADWRGSRYAPLDQISASNFGSLELAWRLKTDNLGPRPEYNLEGTPLMVKGVIYATAGSRRAVVALDAGTGELRWVHSIDEGKRAEASPRKLSGRGLAYWTDGKGDERIVYMTIGYRLVVLDARTGQPVPSFGRKGIVDLKEGLITGTNTPIDLETGEAGILATPTVARDVVLVGLALGEGLSIPTHNNTKGVVRAFDVRTGRKLWEFNNIPRPGEFGNDTWLENSWAYNGKIGVWTQMTVDEELGLVYVPAETPASDMYGGHRPGNNLFAESIVCLDLKTGKRKWHFQVVHHPLWNLDMAAAPLLADLTIDGRMVKAVALPTRQSLLFVFDRVTGKPLFPIEERPVPQGDVPGEWYSPTQPFPVKPPAYGRNHLKVPDDLIDFTPELRAEALQLIQRYKVGPLYTPPILGSADGLLGTLTIGHFGGGTSWPGAAFDPETNIFYSHVGNAGINVLSLAPPAPGTSDLRYVQGVAGRAAARGAGAGNPTAESARPAGESDNRGLSAVNVRGLPLVKPPYGILSAIDMNRAELLWQVPHGDTPDIVRNHAALKGLTIPKTGQGGAGSNVGVLVTKTLLIAGDRFVTSPPGRPRGAMLRAYDKKSGQEVGAVWMPAGQTGGPMTYLWEGKQYIIVAVGLGNHPGEYLAFRLPDADVRSTAQSSR